MANLKIKKETALNLTLEGSIGSFNVGTGQEGQNSLNVQYFLTHVGLDFSSGANEAVLKHLAPVREIFDYDHLDFNEIMQRDIDDARVSSELIPYLLDSKSADLVKLFPPIIVVVLPVRENANRPADHYPAVADETVEAAPDEDHGKRTIRSGEIGKEVFQFEQPVVGGELVKHDLVRFRVNTNRTRLVIVDGQHRAMALLALYRNLKDEWADEKRAPFKEYYEEWTPSYIQKFNLKEINLPVMFCTFPDLDTHYTGDFDLKKAARTVFLTLNKTARKVSNSRNILLDDNDIVAHFLRRLLSEVKAKDHRSGHSLRIANVELDQFEDRLKIQSPIAITGVNHVYYIVEHLLLNKLSEDVKGSKPRSGKFYKRKDLNLYGAMDRLKARDILGTEAADNTDRYTFTNETVTTLSQKFQNEFGEFIIQMLEGFAPYEIHNRSVLDLQRRLEADKDRKLKPILFEGQGISRVFDAHRKNLKAKLDEGEFETDVPSIQALAERLDSTATRVQKAIDELKRDRASKYLDNVSDKAKLRNTDGEYHPKLIGLMNDLYDNVFTTVAFQTAFVCGFFEVYEHVAQNAGKKGVPTPSKDALYEEYVSQLAEFFVPKSASQVKRLVNVFLGELEGEVKEWKVAPSKKTFRNVVYRGEMQPDQWPKYKYLLLEVWNPKNELAAEVVSREVDLCRRQVFNALLDDYRQAFAKELSKTEDALEKSEHQEIFNRTYDAFSGFLKVVGVSGGSIPNKTQFRAGLEQTSYEPEADDLDESWESVGSTS